MNSTLKNTTLLALTCIMVAWMGCGPGGTDEAGGTTESTESVGTEETSPMSAAAADVQKLNLNTATEEQFLAIPNVGDRMVHEFEEYRPYVSIQQFRQEIGKYVDEAQVAAYEQYVFVPVSPNESDEETLMQLPGVDAEEAASLAAARPFESNDVFLEMLGDMVTAEELATAETYLASP